MSEAIPSLAQAKAVAAAHGGVCLATTYEGVIVKMPWQCKKSHPIWMACLNTIKNGYWCPHCAGNARLTIEEMDRLASAHGGKCLTRAYFGARGKLAWMCKHRHVWTATPHSIKQNRTWCPVCGGSQRSTLAEAKRVAARLGGECLSMQYTNLEAYMDWKCVKGHTWRAKFKHIKALASWCPQCSLYRHQAETHAAFEQLTGKRFESNRRGVLSNSRWELDGWCAELRLAFEYHGIQHYRYTPYFHRNGPTDLEKRKEDDSLKELDCEELGIRLIVIPYNVGDIFMAVQEALREML